MTRALAMLALLAAPAWAEGDAPALPDLISFAQGARPVAVATGEADLRVGSGRETAYATTTVARPGRPSTA